MRTALVCGCLALVLGTRSGFAVAPATGRPIQSALIEPAPVPDLVVRRIAAVEPEDAARVLPAAFVPASIPAQSVVTNSAAADTAAANSPATSIAAESAVATLIAAKRLPCPEWQARWQPRLTTPEDVAAAIRAPEKVEWAVKPLSDIKVEINLKQNQGEELPTDYAALELADHPQPPMDPNMPRGNEPFIYYWEASASCSGPLYFEEVNLERYGYSFGILQPAISGAHFFGTIPLLPYKMTLHDPRECVYTLGYSRPGTDTPFQRPLPDLKFGPAVVQSTVALEMIFIIP